GDAIFAANVIGTRNLMEEALRAGIERIVYTSSVATLRCRQDGSSVDESDVLPVHEAIGAYKRSKIVAEQIVLDMVAKRGLPAVIVNPSTPIGPRDMRPKIADLIGRAPPRFKMPGYLALPVAACGEARAWVTKEEPLASWAGVR